MKKVLAVIHLANLISFLPTSYLMTPPSELNDPLDSVGVDRNVFILHFFFFFSQRSLTIWTVISHFRGLTLLTPDSVCVVKIIFVAHHLCQLQILSACILKHPSSHVAQEVSNLSL